MDAEKISQSHGKDKIIHKRIKDMIKNANQHVDLGTRRPEGSSSPVSTHHLDDSKSYLFISSLGFRSFNIDEVFCLELVGPIATLTNSKHPL